MNKFNFLLQLKKEVDEMIWLKKILFAIYDEVDPNAFPSHIWKDLSNYFKKEQFGEDNEEKICTNNKKK